MGSLSSGLAWSLFFLATILGSYDLALIASAVAAYLGLASFSYRGQRTVHQIQQLRPLLEALKARFNDDRAKLNLALLALCRKRHIRLIWMVLGMVAAAAQVLFVVVIYFAVGALPLGTAGYD